MPKLVFYYIQKESGSTLQHPDCFAINKDSQITVGDVLRGFPLALFGHYHIRFRRNNGSSYEWAELLDEEESAPTYNGGIFLKVLDLDKLEKGITRIPIEDSIPDEDSLPEEEEEPLEFTPEESSPMEFLHEDPSPVEISQPEPSFEPDSPIDFLKHVWFPPVTCSGTTQQQHKEEPVNEVCTDKCDPLPMPVHSPSVVVEEAPLECTHSVFMKNRIKHVKRSDIKIDKDQADRDVVRGKESRSSEGDEGS
ncbi:hypothetical protein BLSTO_05348 [Blastocystis sp. subtype 1]